MKVKLSEIAEVTTGYIKHETKQHFKSKTIPVIQLRDLSVNGTIDFDNLKEEEININDRCPELNPGDVIFAAKGSKRSAGVIDREIKNLTASNHYLIIRMKEQSLDRVMPEFLSFYLRQKTAMDYFDLHGTGTHIPFISAAVLKEMPVILPDVEKQKKLTELDRFINIERRLMEKLSELKNGMYKGMLDKVLSGG